MDERRTIPGQMTSHGQRQRACAIGGPFEAGSGRGYLTLEDLRLLDSRSQHYVTGTSKRLRPQQTAQIRPDAAHRPSYDVERWARRIGALLATHAGGWAPGTDARRIPRLLTG